MKKMNWKKWVSILGTVVLGTGALAGCGAEEEKVSNEPGKGKLTIMSWYSPKDFAPVLDGFKEKYPDLEIDFQNVPNEGNQYQQKLNLLANSEELPDVFWIRGPITNFAKNGYMKDISEMESVQKLADTYKEDYSYDGKVYAYAPDSWVGGMFYNKDLYEEYGFQPPKDWAEFIEQSKVFLENGIKPLGMFGAALPDLIYWLHDTEGIAKDPELDDKINRGEMKFSEVYSDVMELWYKDCVETGIVSQDMVSITDEQRLDEFATGKAAATLTGPWAIKGLMEKNPDLNIGVLPFVGTEGNTYAMGATNIGIAINAKAKNPENAELFLEYMGTDETLQKYQGVTGNFLGVEGVEYEVDPAMEPMKEYAESGKFLIPTSKWTYTDTIDSMMQRGTQEIVMGTKTVEDVLKEVDDKMAELLASEQ